MPSNSSGNTAAGDRCLFCHGRATQGIFGGGPNGVGCILGLGAFGVVALALLLSMWFQPMDAVLFGDSIAYLGGANGFVERGSFCLPEWIGRPSAGAYPPGNSLLLAVPRAVFGPQCDHPVAFGRWQIVVGLVSLAGIFQLMRRMRVPIGLSLSTVGSLAVSLNFSWAHFHLWPDAVFAGTVCFAASFWMGHQPVGLELKRWHLTGLFLGWALLLKPAALPFVGAAGLGALTWLVRPEAASRSWRPLAAYSIWPVFAFIVWSWSSVDAVSYADLVRDQWDLDSSSLGHRERFWQNLRHVLGGHVLVDGTFPLWIRFVGIAGRGGAAIGAGLDLLREAVHASLLLGVAIWVGRTQSMAARLLLLALLAYAGAAVFMPFELSVRHIFVAAPVAVAWIHGFLVHLRPRWSRGISACLITLMCVQTVLGAFWSLETLGAGFRWAAANRRGLDQMAAHFQKHLGQDEVVAVAFTVDVMHLHARFGREFLVDYLTRPNLSGWVSHRQQGFVAADYVLIPGELPAGSPFRSMLWEVYRTDRGTLVLYQVDPEAEQKWRAKTGYPQPEPRPRP